MKHLDTHRFGKLLVWTAQSNKTEILRALTMLFIICFGFQMMPALLCLAHGSATFLADYLHVWFNMISLILGAYIWISGIRIFRNMLTKEQRINYLMLPATDLEKWLVRIVYIFTVYIVGGILVFVVADLLRMGFYLLFYGDYVASATVFVWDFLHILNPALNDKNLALFVLFVSGTVWSHSFFLLGGTLFRKQPFIFSSFMMFLLALLLGSILDFIHSHVLISLSRDELNLVFYAVASAGFALTVMHYWLSYKIFHHMQVINNKWLNVL